MLEGVGVAVVVFLVWGVVVATDVRVRVVEGLVGGRVGMGSNEEVEEGRGVGGGCTAMVDLKVRDERARVRGDEKERRDPCRKRQKRKQLDKKDGGRRGK